MSEVEMVLPEKPVFTPHDWLYGMTLDIPDMPPLKPCPFCGNVPAICRSEHGWFVICPSCKTISDNYSSCEVAKEMWNRRNTDAKSETD
ncbi:MAG: Lar family restriction alleviation protein [Synergistaceae bacterium]|nr:Lar family restriction alleviation protein [Synergistaceae bacterium]